MKKILLFCIVLVTFARTVLCQTHTQSFTFDDLGLGGGTASSGTYNQNDTFSFDVYLTFAGYNCYGYDLIMETQTLNNFADSLSVTGMTYGTAFPDVLQSTPNPAPFNVPQGASPRYLREGRDLGAMAAGQGASFLPVSPGTYFVGHISFTIAGAIPGTYTLETLGNGPFKCVAASFNGTTWIDNIIPIQQYTITIVPEPAAVPEPATAMLLGLGAVGLAATLRAQRRAK